MPTDLAQVNRLGRHVQQSQGASRLQRHAGGLGEIIGGTQGHQHQAGVGVGMGHGFGHIAQGAVATAGNDMGVPLGQRFIDQSPGITALPRHPHGQLPTLLTPGQHGSAHILVEGLFAVKDQQGFGGGHLGESPGSRCLKDVDLWGTGKVCGWRKLIEVHRSRSGSWLACDGGGSIDKDLKSATQR